MIIFRGWGAAVVIGIGFLALMAGALVGNILRLDRDAITVVSAIFLIPAGILTWYVGKRMNRNMDRELIDPSTGERVIVRNDHSLFFIRVEWWGPILAVGGILLVILFLIADPGAGN